MSLCKHLFSDLLHFSFHKRKTNVKQEMKAQFSLQASNDDETDQTDIQLAIHRRVPTRHSIKSLKNRKTLAKQNSISEVIFLLI